MWEKEKYRFIADKVSLQVQDKSNVNWIFESNCHHLCGIGLKYLLIVTVYFR